MQKVYTEQKPNARRVDGAYCTRQNAIMQTVARTWWQRTKGLIGRRSLAPGETLLIPGCRQVHTFFMWFPIEAAFLDRSGREIAVYRLKPWRISPYIRAAAACVERGVNKP